MSERQEKIAQLYYRSRSIDFGAFRLSIHNDNPDLPPSPWYLKFPGNGNPGSEFMPAMHQLIADEFHDMAQAHDPTLVPQRVAGLPNGATPLGEAYAKNYPAYPNNLLKFNKVQHADGRTEYVLEEGKYEPGDLLDPCEDHMSGARNNSLFLRASRDLGFVVKRLFLVVDRQQGGIENMKSQGVEVLPIFTADTLLEYGLAEGHIAQARFDEVREYRAANQIRLADLTRAAD